MNIQEEYKNRESNYLENFEEETEKQIILQRTTSRIGQAMPIFCV